jgi:hypothetical protein
MEREVTLYDIELPGFTALRGEGWRVLKYEHGVVLARRLHPGGLVEFGTWEPDFEGAFLTAGDYVFSRGDVRGRSSGFSPSFPIPDEVLKEFAKRAKGWALRRFREVEKEE